MKGRWNVRPRMRRLGSSCSYSTFRGFERHRACLQTASAGTTAVSEVDRTSGFSNIILDLLDPAWEWMKRGTYGHRGAAEYNVNN